MCLKKLYFILMIVGLGMINISCEIQKEVIKMDVKQKEERQGGGCVYISYDGDAEIIRIIQTQNSISQSKIIGGPGYEGYEVWFRFIPQQEISNEWVQKAISKEHLFTLYNSWYVGPLYLKKYGIEIGKTYPCKLKVIKKGVCTPLIFEIETLNRADYFEKK
ncbi:MAG: hypothetical protein AB1567_08040 [bacterium]